MKMKWNEKTKKITVIAALAAVGIIALAGISICIYKDNPQSVEIAEAEVTEDMVDIPEDSFTVPVKVDTIAPEAEEIVVSTEVSKETEPKNTYVQSIQPTPVKTEDKKPAEASDEAQGTAKGNKESKTENTEKPAEQPSGDTDSSQHGNIQGDKIYIDGFGWVDYNGGETVEIQADNIYENGNKIGIMD